MRNSAIKLVALSSFYLISNYVIAQSLQPWMSQDVSGAWNSGYKGQGTTVTVVDTFNSSTLVGNMNGSIQNQAHGLWTAEQTNLIAPLAKENLVSFTSTAPVQLANKGLNVINLSFAMYAPSGYTANQINWSGQEKSIINYASTGAAVIAKAAGNDSVVGAGVAVGATNRSGQIDYLDSALIGAKSAIFVGALNGNGSTSHKSTMAWYSNIAGTNTVVQKQFLSVGVAGNTTNLYGTSFAAPVISGYSAILGSKFTGASSSAIANQLLNTARTDTIANYNAQTYGRGEASLARALAPVSIK
jgi:hypothetical protein